MESNGDNNYVSNTPLKKIISKRGRWSLIINDHKYYVGSANRYKCTTRWRCVMKHCPAKIYTDENVDSLCNFEDFTEHNHEPFDARTIHRQLINAQCKELAIQDLESSPKEIIKRVVQENRNNDIVFSDEDKKKMLKNMYEARSKFIATGQKFPWTPPVTPRATNP